MQIVERLTKLREVMKEKKIDFYIVPTADFHQSENAGDFFKSREFITGFTGSAGTSVITADKAMLWTDGRYFIQAGIELEGSTVDLMKMGEPGVPTILEYLESAVEKGQTLGVDGRVISVKQGQEYAELVEKKGAHLVIDYDLIDMVWEDRPEMSTEPAFALDIKYTGESTAHKLERIREVMKEENADKHILTSLDDVCWILNIRGNDIEYYPLIFSYAVISMDKMDLYMDERKLDDAMKASFADDGIEVHPYFDIYSDITTLEDGCRLLLDPDRLNYALYRSIPENVVQINRMNPEITFKAIKNEVEIENIKKAELKDAVAHVKFMKWLKDNVGSMKITEISASEKLDELRVEQGNFIRPSFEPISSCGEHGAIVHYTASPETDKEVTMNTMLMTDTGAGFYEGSTDITRTYAFGEIPQIMKEHFTLVAVSHLRLAAAKFLKGCTGPHLDVIARQPFWDRGLNYNHGTGHGVGYLLNIHEDPCSISWRARVANDTVLQSGMILTDEPGIYIEGSHGIRLEDELLVREGEKNEYGQFMYFEDITYIPLDLDAIAPEIMTETDKQLLNAYHKDVYDKVSPYLNDEEKDWLKKYTRAI